VPEIRYFNSATEFRGWLESNHATATELWVGFYQKGSGKGGLTYAEGVDEALCYGWIDGLKKRVGEFSYTHRFSPRKTRSNWSRINVQHAERLKRAGRMAAAGLRAYASRLPERSDAYSYENAPKRLAPAYEKKIQSKQSGVELLSEPTTRVPTRRHLVGHVRKEAGDADAQVGKIDRSVSEPTEGGAAHWVKTGGNYKSVRLRSRSADARASGLFNHYLTINFQLGEVPKGGISSYIVYEKTYFSYRSPNRSRFGFTGRCPPGPRVTYKIAIPAGNLPASTGTGHSSASRGRAAADLRRAPRGRGCVGAGLRTVASRGCTGTGTMPARTGCAC
jgi:hypothetical protein